jgi:hypothetical protein
MDLQDGHWLPQSTIYHFPFLSFQFLLYLVVDAAKRIPLIFKDFNPISTFAPIFFPSTPHICEGSYHSKVIKVLRIPFPVVFSFIRIWCPQPCLLF